MKRTIAILVASLLGTPMLLAQHQHQHTEAQQAPIAEPIRGEAKGPHGGPLQTAGGVQIESVLAADGIRVFAYDAQGLPLDARAARGVTVLQIEGDAKRYRYDLFPDVAENGAADSLAVAVDLRRIAGLPVSIETQLVGLPSAAKQPLRVVAEAAVPMTEKQLVAAAIAKQKVCPVSGQPLGSMGEPIGVAVGDQTIYVCCQGCVAPVKAEPAKYLAMVSGGGSTVPPGSEAVRPGVFKTVAADQPFIAAQKTCPVMDEPLGGMGAPLKVHAEGKAIYICCAGCAKKIQAEPAKYLKILADQGVTAPTLETGEADVVSAGGEEVRPGVFKVAANEQPYVEAQKLCPVMDEPLDGMGGPYRVNVEGKAVYICCPGCAKKLHTEPKQYLQKLASQGIEPPAVK